MSTNSVVPFIILGAGQPFTGEQHTALRFATGSSRVLDWALRAVSAMQVEPHFVAGYQAEQVREHYPEFVFHFNSDWQDSRAGWSLMQALPDAASHCLVAYADILFRESVVRALQQQDGDVVVAVDSHWRTRYAGRSQADLERCEKVCLAGSSVTRLGAAMPGQLAGAEFIGLVHFSVRALDCLRDWKGIPAEQEWLRHASLSDLVERLRMQGLQVQAVDVLGDWAQLNESADLARFVLGTKAQTLNRLHGMIHHARIEEQVCFTVQQWGEDRAAWLDAVRQLGCSSVVVRSSALSEDGFHQSNAGVYTSLLDVNVADAAGLGAAIETVIASYPDGDPANEVLVQPMLQDVVASGVVFTRTLAQGAPYYVVNYDDVTGSTESITSGSSREHKTLVMRRDAALDSAAIPARLSSLLPALREIESRLGYDSLDVEFAVTAPGHLHILQVRPIAVDHSGWGDADGRFYALLASAEKLFAERQQTSPFVQGGRTIFGVMPDWNPAEIIGTKPGQLAVSLYRDLIMDETWATQRAEYGYRDVRPHPLLHVFAGHPYVDVRASLNSFIPAQLPDSLAGRIVDFCLDWLQAHPELHDKLEFEVVPTCFSLDFARWEERFASQGGLAASELTQWRAALLDITNGALGRNAKDFAAIEQLEQRFAALQQSSLTGLGRVFALLDDARRYGTLPFAHLARSAFVAVTLLRSAVPAGVLTQAEVDDFLNTIRTVSQDYTQDARACARGELPWDEFVSRYGHLRPGTYDILSPSYRQDPERYLRPTVNQALETSTTQGVTVAGSLWQAARARFVQALNKAGIAGTADAIEGFLRQAIEGREYAKFAFTRNLSAVLDELADWGGGHGLGAGVLAQLGLEDLRALHYGQVSVSCVRDWLEQRAASAMEHRDLVEALELPPLLCCTEDFRVFQYPATQANFIGSTPVTAASIDLDSSTEKVSLAGCIVLIPQADPGYDWLFGRRIGGLITMYGGANSHMAIRAAEFGLPAAIGVGEVRYRKLASARTLELDPVNRLIRRLD